jgi:Xaa-Pro dipeptidase
LDDQKENIGTIQVQGLPASTFNEDIQTAKNPKSLIKIDDKQGSYMDDKRLEKLGAILEKNGISAIALNAGPSLSYFTGLNFHLMERPVVLFYVPGQKPVLVLPGLEAAKIEDETRFEPFFYDENPQSWSKIFTTALNHLNLLQGKIGVEPLQLRYFEYTLLQSAGELLLVDGSPVIAALRSRKEHEEIQLMQHAVDIAENSLRAVLPLIRVGMEEKELAAELVLQLFRHDSDPSLPFDPIVATGPNSANPHAKPSDRKLEEGDLLVIDWGAKYKGYVSDLTRTYGVGNIDTESAAIHMIVQQANAAGRAAGKKGAACSDVDHAARQVIENAGYGKYFTHRTGHGIGMQCHEEPYMHGDSQTVMQHGMTYTVEPGIYLPGKNGVRIEDDVYLSDDGPVSLSSLPRDIISVG